MSSLAARNRRTELMDSPDIDPGRFVGSLAGLRRVNFVTGSAQILWPAVAEFAARKSGRPLRLLDVACGAGDTLIRLARFARRAGIQLELAGCDINPLAVDFARDAAGRAGCRATFFRFDALHGAFPEDIDVIVTSLFLHHLDDDDAVKFLQRAADATRGLFLVQDLVRNRAGYLLAALGIPLLLCNDVCRNDGPASVEGAFTVGEVRELAKRAGLHAAIVEPRFPCRFLLTWKRP